MPGPENHIKDYVYRGSVLHPFADKNEKQAELDQKFQTEVLDTKATDKDALGSRAKILEKEIAKLDSQIDAIRGKGRQYRSGIYWKKHKLEALKKHSELIGGKLAEMTGVENDTKEKTKDLRVEVNLNDPNNQNESGGGIQDTITGERDSSSENGGTSPTVVDPNVPKLEEKVDSDSGPISPKKIDSQWSHETQNKIAAEIANKKLKSSEPYTVKGGETLGAIVKGLTEKLDWGMEVDYRSNRLGSKPKPTKLAEANLIYPGQKVWVESGKIIVADEVPEAEKEQAAASAATEAAPAAPDPAVTEAAPAPAATEAAPAPAAVEAE